ncbi:MAG: DNA mismatch repair endonuclease MutL [Nitrospiraceae bacterium]|nr:DNA mismatch repair endonuclease MutL [Nitrospiraceae bacterium]
MGIIRELPIHVVNKIAAGEVVERPASIVKELFENSLDAGATKVSIVVSDGGIKEISISDNGSGIFREDLPKAFLRHATSKIFSYEDLFKTVSMGFRGEALAAIASVSRLDLKTKTEGDPEGSHYESVPGMDPVVRGWDGPKGTTIRISELFRNVPVRQKFLKTPATELSHIQTTVLQIALGHPEVSISLSTPDRTLLSLPARTSLAARLVDIYPEFDQSELSEILIEGEELSVRAFVLTPSRIRKDRQNQHLFLNRRWVRHPAFYQAVTAGSHGLIQRDVHLGVWVFLTIDPRKVDVNVHPTKKEVRFQEPDRIFALVRRSVSEGIESFSGKSPFAPESRTFPESFPEPPSSSGPSPEQSLSADHSGHVSEERSPGSLGAFSGTASMTGDDRSFSHPSPVRTAGWFPEREGSSPYHKSSGTFSGLSEKLRSLPSPGAIKPLSIDFRENASAQVLFLAQAYETFLIVSVDGTLALVDQHTAHERIRYDALKKMFSAGEIRTQPFLFPAVVRLSAGAISRIEPRIDELKAIGFSVEPIGPESLRVDSIPAILEGEDPQLLMEELSGSSGGFEFSLLRSDRIDETLMTLSCHTSIRAHQVLEKPDAERLVKTLLETDYPFSCPHGRPTILSLEKGMIESWFDRT